ncbi:MAG: Transcription-repair coupling factor [candidate division WS6 bacterium GW2011_GWD1_35_594]|nr:MAG: Transcription-repair coupling factor [candidate division WS6 bacterium GW2011_GWF2_33_92]KKP82248.1 MAG: Transcription-repair coupling factor [candidate division WS6 bacterium GW2011_GWD1_35_594]
MKDFTEDFKNKYILPKLEQNTCISIGKQYEEFLAEVLGSKLKRGVCITSNDNEQEPQYRVLSVDDIWDIDQYMNLGYIRVERVWNSGELSILGDTVIIWPYSSKEILRIILFGNTIESIEIVDAQSRKKIKEIYSTKIFSNEQGVVIANGSEKDMLVLRNTPNIFLTEGSIDMGIRSLPNLHISDISKSSNNILRDYKSRGYTIWYLTNDIFKYESEGPFAKYIDEIYERENVVENSLKNGFVYESGKLVVLTDREYLGEVELAYSVKDKNIDPSSLDLLKKITPGDFVVHEDHGIGKFLGLIDKNDNQYIEIAYAGNDRLYVPLYSSKKVMKYIGSGKNKPTLTGLNSGVWKRISSRAKEDVEKIAKELLQIYALREISKSKRVIDSPSKLEQYWEFVNDFEFSDTEDQYIASQKIAQDLSRDIPMDRLLVGDVGFGKTEIAMRATFAVVNSGMQVAVLAPTTVLANQHMRVFKKRFSKYPFNIQVISRLQSTSQRSKIEEDVSNGKIDILIGTHALLSKSINFKNLGLLVVDEEQKFGVKQKESLKSNRVDTHVLSMTATPIPRTLNMSLMGIRDISVLAIPPLGRRDILNEFSKFSFEKVKDCILRELKRGGQVYYLHNRVESIYTLGDRLKELIPDMRMEVAHGRLSGNRLIEVMDRFVNGDIDVLLCTTIIENGLDISNANTLIIDDVNRLGLSQMYQIRGRVGRGQRQAYACFFFEDLRGDATLRLEALRESEALGSGFVLSNRDLEIRGAGDILGKKQSGTINSIGYGLYTQLLYDAVEVLKGSHINT